MADAAWPTGSVPFEPEQSGYSEEITSNLASFSPDTGMPSVWRRSTLQGSKVSATIIMSGTELAAFQTFFRTTLGDGSLPFTWTNPAYGVSKRWMFDPGSPPQWAAFGFDIYRVQLSILKLS